MSLNPSLAGLPRINGLIFLAGLAGIVIGTAGIQIAGTPASIKFFDNLHWTAATAAAAILAWLGWRQARTAAHRWFAIGFAGYAFGQAVWDVQVMLAYSRFPAPSDFLYLWLGPCLSLGLAHEIRTRTRKTERKAILLDVLSLSIAALTLTLVLYLPKRGELDALSLSVLVAYPVSLMIVACIGLIMIPALRLRPSLSFSLFLPAIAVTAWSWMNWNIQVLEGAPTDGQWSNVSFSVAILLAGLAASFWRLEHADNLRWDRLCEGFLRLLPFLVVVLASSAMIAASSNQAVSHSIKLLTLAGSIAVIVLAVIRQGELLKERDKLAAAQAEVVRGQELLHSVIDTVPVRVYWKDREGRYLGCNTAFAQDAGLSHPDELVGKDDFQLAWGEHARAFREDDRAVLDSATPRVGIELPQTTPDGHEAWLRASRVPLRDGGNEVIGVLGMYEDITPRKLLEFKLKQSEQMLMDILENVSAYIYLKDTQGRYVFVNRLVRELWGASMEEIAGFDDSKFFDPATVENIRQNDHRVLHDGETIRREETNTVANTGHTATYWSVKMPLRREDGSIYALCGISTDITAIKQHEKQLENIAHYDALTGVPNRVLLADRMHQALAQSRRGGKMLVICYLDLDGFKPINDNLGHAAGDQVLVEVARRLQTTIRGGDTVARLGGDEFVVLLLGLDSLEECASTLTRMLGEIAQPIPIDGKTVELTASIGVSIYPNDDADTDTLLRHADQAMYVAKQSGKNRYHLYDPEQDLRTRSRQALANEIRQGLAAQQFELFYQPKVELSSKKWVGAEALIRWHHPERGLLAPGEFLRAIEESDLDIELGEWVIATALAQLQRWHQAGLEIELSINISTHHLQSPHFVGRLREQMARAPALPAGRLQIEVLETTALEDMTTVTHIIEACHALGVGFALDDFGTGYSSLTYLSKLPVDTLKIDQSFVRDMLEDSGDHAIVQGIIALADAFDRQTVAEGIETEQQYLALLKMGCEIGQGYGIARPMPIADLTAWQTGPAAAG